MISLCKTVSLMSEELHTPIKIMKVLLFITQTSKLQSPLLINTFLAEVLLGWGGMQI